MTKLERAIEALEALPEDEQDAIADMVLEWIELSIPSHGESTLTQEQLDEARRRSANFVPGDPARIDQILARRR